MSAGIGSLNREDRNDPVVVLARMLANIGVDFMLGAVPLAGDALDFAWKANRKNARLLEQHLRRSSGLRDMPRG